MFSIGHHLGSTFTGTDGDGPNYRIGPDCAGRAELQYRVPGVFYYTIRPQNQPNGELL